MPNQDFLTEIETFFESLDLAKTKPNIEDIQKNLKEILINTFSYTFNYSDIIQLRIRFFDIQGGMQAVDYKPKKSLTWSSRQSTYEENSPAAFFSPPLSINFAPEEDKNKTAGLLIIYGEGEESCDDDKGQSMEQEIDTLDVWYPDGNSELKLYDKKIVIEQHKITDLYLEDSYSRAIVNKNDEVDIFIKDVFDVFEEYLKRYFSDSPKITKESLYDAFRKSTLPMIKTYLQEEDIERVYSYFFPIIYAGEMVAQMTIVSKKPLPQFIPDISKIEHTYRRIGFLSHMLSSTIAKSGIDSSKPLTYFHTQSLLLWFPHNENLETKESQNNLLKYLEKTLSQTKRTFLENGYKALVEGAVLPLGEREISKTILVEIIDPLLRVFLKIPQKKDIEKDESLLEKCKDSEYELYNRMSYLLETALDNQDNLKNIPQYRQHFIHSFHVFLTGLRLISSNDKILDKWVQKFKKDYSRRISKNDLIKAWFFAAIFHDISYVIANIETWVNEAISKTIFDENESETEKKSWIRHQLPNIFRVGHYHRALQELIVLVEKFWPEKNHESNKFHRDLFSEAVGPNENISKADHGVLSAVMFLNATEKFWNKDWVKLAADSIAFHSSYWSKYPTSTKNLYENPKKTNVLRDLLLISDTIQQWGRTESEELQRIFTIKLDYWDDENDSKTIKIGYQLNRETRKCLNSYCKGSLNYSDIKNECRDPDKVRIKNLVKFANTWNIIRSDKMEQKDREFFLPNLYKIILKLEIQKKDETQIKEKLGDIIEEYLKDKAENKTFNLDKIEYEWN